eukprot:m.1118636 g.1118636  ORF g.1118636 m.1118636 type:complete len:162 (+) comp24385_c0_seq33:46-531(+)
MFNYDATTAIGRTVGWHLTLPMSRWSVGSLILGALTGHCCPEHVHDIGFWCYHTDTAAPTPALAAAPAHMCIGHACDCHPPTPSLFEMAAARKRARAGGAGATPTSVHVATPPTPPSAHPDVFVEDDFLRCVRTFIGADWLGVSQCPPRPLVIGVETAMSC